MMRGRFKISVLQFCNVISPVGTLLVYGSPPSAAKTPVLMPELVLINYQERPYLAATSKRKGTFQHSWILSKKYGQIEGDKENTGGKRDFNETYSSIYTYKILHNMDLFSLVTECVTLRHLNRSSARNLKLNEFISKSFIWNLNIIIK